MKNYLLLLLSAASITTAAAKEIKQITGPNGNLSVKIELKSGTPYYTASYKGKTVIEPSPLGIVTSLADLSKGLQQNGEVKERVINETYSVPTNKFSTVNYVANEIIIPFKDNKNNAYEVVFRLSNNDIAFRYNLLESNKQRYCTINKENTGFKLPSNATTYITPQALPGAGWETTKPSYEEEYTMNEPVGSVSKYGVGYTFPALFKVENNWALISETGVDSRYAGCRLGESSKDGLYMIEFPQKGENNGVGSSEIGMTLPGHTAWRTITIGDNLKPIVETTVSLDVVEPIYEASQEYKYGKGTWSWIVWQDESCNYDDQVIFIDLASNAGLEYILIDAHWNYQIGYDRMPELIKYAKSKNVDVWLWYNSNGYWNNAPQGPRGMMDKSAIRQTEMAWMKAMGVKGIKVDFFGGDKQETMKLYEDILTDANTYGLMVDFHGTTLPRGWERMFPNFIGSEAVLASENVYFEEYHAKKQALQSTILPFTRNAVASMEWGGVFLNEYMSKDNKSRHKRYTTDAYEAASLIHYFCPVQFLAITPNNLEEKPKYLFDFIREVPTTWDETRFVDGKIGEYCIMMRRKGDKWYLSGTNALSNTLKLTLNIPEFANKTLNMIADSKDRESSFNKVKIGKDGKVKIEMLVDGGVVIFE